MIRNCRILLILSLALLYPGLAGCGDGPPAVLGDVAAAGQAWTMIGDGALLIDVRSPEEFDGGHVDGSVNIAHTEISELAEFIGDDLARPVVLYCRSGGRAGRARSALEEMGYTGIFNGTGYEALMVTEPCSRRAARHDSMPENTALPLEPCS